MTKLGLMFLAIFSFAPYLASAIAIPQSNAADRAKLDIRSAEIVDGTCNPKYIETTALTDSNHARRATGDTDPPDPQSYEYAEQPLKDKGLVNKGYLNIMVGRFDDEAQSHRDFNEPIPVEGYTIKVRFEGIWLEIVQKGDNNLVWGNVKNAIAVMKNYYQKVTEITAYRLEVAILNGAYPEGYVRMIDPFRGCGNVD